MSEIPRLAIIIPCYNYEHFVGRAIQSVTSQMRADCEIVVVDDGSSDNSWSIISETKVPAFRVTNRGARLACLYALQHTRANFILFLDADDELKPGALDKIIFHLDPSVAKLQFGLTRIDAHNSFISTSRPALSNFRDRDNLIQQVLKTGVYRTPPTSGNVFRRDLCQLLSDAHYDRYVDGIMLFAAPLYGDVVSIADELGFYRIHGTNASRLGQRLEAKPIRDEIARFQSTMEHLKRVMLDRGYDAKGFDPARLFVNDERNLYLQVITGRRPHLTFVLKLIQNVFFERYSIKEKIALSVIFLLAAILPHRRAQNLISFRMRPEGRSIPGLFRAILN